MEYLFHHKADSSCKRRNWIKLPKKYRGIFEDVSHAYQIVKPLIPTPGAPEEPPVGGALLPAGSGMAEKMARLRSLKKKK